MFRVWFGSEEDALVLHERHEPVVAAKALGGLIEWSSATYVAVDASTAAQTEAIDRYLTEQTETAGIMFERACPADPPE